MTPPPALPQNNLGDHALQWADALASRLRSGSLRDLATIEISDLQQLGIPLDQAQILSVRHRNSCSYTRAYHPCFFYLRTHFSVHTGAGSAIDTTRCHCFSAAGTGADSRAVSGMWCLHTLLECHCAQQQSSLSLPEM